MSAKVFVDTNILVYARDASEPDKQPRAEACLVALWESGRGCLSTQVLSEYHVTVTSRLKPGMSRESAWEDVEALFAWDPISVDAALQRQARQIENLYRFSWWDCMIVSAALTARARYLLTEDLQDGQRIEDLQIVNPFTTELDGILN